MSFALWFHVVKSVLIYAGWTEVSAASSLGESTSFTAQAASAVCSTVKVNVKSGSPSMKGKESRGKSDVRAKNEGNFNRFAVLPRDANYFSAVQVKLRYRVRPR